jgi:hypothetical protein
MKKKEDIILECFIVKGKELDYLGVIFEGKESGLRALSRQYFSGNQVFLEFLTDENQQSLSERLNKKASLLADRYGLHPVHLIYPGGIEESRFIRGLREAKKLRQMNVELLNN